MTLFQHIRKLPAATWLRVRDNGAIEEQRYWDVWDHVDPLTRCSEREIAERLIGELRTAVALRKVSDVPVGVFLSGGIDSSTNAALFQEKSAGMVKTFSIGYDADYRTCPNESHWARRVADYIGAEHYERRLAQSDLLDFLPQMVQLQGEPIADPVCVPIHYVSQLARQNGVVVCQLGEGADELFCGYPSWMKLLRAARWNAARGAAAGRAIAGAALRLAGDGCSFAGELLRRGSLGQPIFWSGYEAFTEAQKQRLISARLRRRLGGLTSWEPLRAVRRRFEEAAWEKSELNWMSYADMNLRLPELLLMRVDKMSMGVAVEARVPFLDHRFVELAMSIPSQTKAPNGVLKYILKRAVRGIIPNEIIDRPKQGFSAPIYEWVLSGLGEHAERELHGFCRETDLLDRAAVDSLVANARRGKREAQQLWFVLNLALWWKQFIGGEADRTACAVALAHS
jgi:asparagine synthase (glutamine-hydrolysing)